MTAKTSFRGSFTALVTPFSNGALDEKAFRGLVDWQIAEGTNGLVPVGTTGESPTLSHEEHKRVVEWCIEQAKGRVPVVAGAGSNSTREAIEFARHAEKAGADAVLIVTPYYNKPTQEGLYQHFKAINDAIGIPIIIYNIPVALGDRHVGRHHEAAVRAREHRRRQGRDRERGARLAAARRNGRGVQSAFRRGCDRARLHGARRARLHLGDRERGAQALRRVPGRLPARRLPTALDYQDKLMPLHMALFIETNPAPAKYALSVLGKCAETVRLPMVTLAEKTKTAVREAMVHAGLIN